MKFLSLTILILVIAFPTVGQDIEHIIVYSQEADEPPTKQGRPEFVITFEKNKSGEFIAQSYLVNTRRRT